MLGFPARASFMSNKAAAVTSSIPVDELRRLLRLDVEAVVRAELRSALAAAGPQDPDPLPSRKSSDRLELPTGSSRGLAPAVPRGRTSLTSKEAVDRSPPPSPRLSLLSPRSPRGRRGSVASMVSATSATDSRLGVWQQSSGYQLLKSDGKDTFEVLAKSAFRDKDSCVRRTARYADALWGLEEEPRTGRFAEFVHGNSFQTFFTCVIAANVALMVHTVNQDIQVASSAEVNTTSWSTKADLCFLALYCVEMCCKIVVHRLFFFWNEDMCWNWLDFVLVVHSMVDSVAQAQGEHRRGATWMRTLRVFRVAKVLRILRFIKFFSQLRLIMNAIVGSIISLFWSLVVFAIIFLIFSLYFVSAVAPYLESNYTADGQDFGPLIHSFGSVQDCMRTMFSTVTGGEDWEDFYDLLCPVGTASGIFIFYVFLSQIALLNVVTGLFVDSTLKLSEPDVHERAQLEFVQEQKLAHELKSLFMTADKDGRKRLSRAEFRAILDNGKLANFFKFLGFDPQWSKKNLPRLFDKVVEQQEKDKGGGISDNTEVDPHTFVETCMALRGNARRTDVREIHGLLLQIQAQQALMHEQLLQEPRGAELSDADSVATY